MKNMDFWFFWSIFRRRWNVILIVAGVCAIVTFFYSKLFIKPVYRSSVSLYLGRVTDDSALGRQMLRFGNGRTSEIARDLALGERLSTDYQALINFDIVSEGVREKLEKIGKWNGLKFTSSVEQSDSSRVMKINIDSYNPLFCQEVASIYAGEFIKQVQKIVGLQNTQIIEEPGFPRQPIYPVSLNLALKAFAAGAFLMFIFYVAAKMLDRTIHSVEDVENALSVPVVGTVHKDTELADDENGPLFFNKNSDADRARITEDFRVFRVNLINNKSGDDGSVIAVTSVQAKEGKTFCTVNLGAALAEAGYKVLLVDCDNGVRSLQHSLKGKSGKGLMDILSNDAEFENVVCKDVNDIKNMDVLYGGDEQANTANLMISPKFRELMNKVKKQYDYALLDVSCHLGTADIVSAGSSADSVLLLVRAGKTQGEAAKQTVEVLKRANLDISGVILNGVEEQ